MKRFLLIALVSVFTTSMFAQLHISAEFGYDHNWLVTKTKDTNSGGFGNYDGFHVGPVLDYYFPKVKGLGIGTALFYQFTASKIIKESSTKTKSWSEMHNLEIPLRVEYKHMINNDWGVFAFAGPVLNFHLDWVNRMRSTAADMKKCKNDVHCISGNVIVRDADGNKTKYKMDKDDRYSCFDLGLGFGAGASWKQLYFRLGVDFGLVNLSKDSDFRKDFALRNHQLKLAIGYTFK
ncbi:MAG: PorT family protein [Paludibacteraceae bacterium]|nr:PorT family protein [Paludibacteraceae bacterium]